MPSTPLHRGCRWACRPWSFRNQGLGSEWCMKQREQTCVVRSVIWKCVRQKHGITSESKELKSQLPRETFLQTHTKLSCQRLTILVLWICLFCAYVTTQTSWRAHLFAPRLSVGVRVSWDKHGAWSLPITDVSAVQMLEVSIISVHSVNSGWILRAGDPVYIRTVYQSLVGVLWQSHKTWSKTVESHLSFVAGNLVVVRYHSFGDAANTVIQSFSWIVFTKRYRKAFGRIYG